MARRVFDDGMLAALRQLPLTDALNKLGIFWKIDSDFRPEKDMRTVRLHVSSVTGRAWEILVTGDKWFDTRAGKGGGGSIDLVMYLLEVNFVAAVKQLLS